MMSIFSGFKDGKQRSTPVPGQFFTELLPEIDHLGELKVTLYAIWRLDHSQGNFRFLQLADFAADEKLMASLGGRPSEARAALEDALERTVLRGSLLRVSLQTETEEQIFYFLNSPKGRAAVEAIRAGKWKPEALGDAPFTLDMARPNIFQLYEAQVGPLTPLVADALRDAEEIYPAEWLEDAFRRAAERNVHSWRYIQAILRSWKEKGRDEQDRKDAEKDRRSYHEGEFSDFIEH